MYTDVLNRYINSNYKSIKKMLKVEWRKMETSEFDEDIFHDTLIKCMDKFNDKDFIEDEFKAYIVSSFKMNVIRSKQYYNVSMKSNDDVETLDSCISNKLDVDYNIIIRDIRETFGDENCEKFLDWLENKSIKEINETYNCNNSRYLIDKIRNYVKDKYKDK